MTCSRSSPTRKRPRRNSVLRVALTGGIACGKSVVARLLAEKGCVVFSADREAHALMAPGPAGLEGRRRPLRPVRPPSPTGRSTGPAWEPSSSPIRPPAASSTASSIPWSWPSRRRPSAGSSARAAPGIFVVEAALTVEAGLRPAFRPRGRRPLRQGRAGPPPAAPRDGIGQAEALRQDRLADARAREEASTRITSSTPRGTSPGRSSGPSGSTRSS
ncbi:MAG: dephospho-CoA kinase [Desulfomicrobium escambiense]|nr:dephospho-CoA kinase [Desulfomicrobium escambiense]